MEHSESKRTLQSLILMLLAGSLGCQPAAGHAPDVATKAVSVEQTIEFGPGSFDLPDPRVGLAQASSYESKLTTTFDGTRAGQPLTWSTTYTYDAVNDPASRQLTIESAGDQSQPPVVMLELKGVAYRKAEKQACTADVIDAGNSAVTDLEPAAQLPSLFGAEEAGTEAVNGVQAVHYTFDERALTEAGLNTSKGELWLASEGGYVLRYRQTTAGEARYFGDDTQGTLSRDYELTQINKPVKIDLPAGCPPGLVDAPRLPDAAKVESLPGLLQYETASSVADVAAFYGQQLPKLGWNAPSSDTIPPGMSAEEYQQALQALQALGLSQAGGPAEPTPTPNPDEAYLVFDQGTQRLRVSITRANGATQVFIALGSVSGQ